MSYSFSRDRTAELKSPNNNDQYQKPHDWGYSPRGGGSNNNTYEMSQVSPDITNIQVFFEQLDRAKNEIDSLNYQIDQIANLHSTLLQSLNDQQSRQASNDLERMKSSAQRTNFNVKAMIQEMQSGNNQLPNNSDTQMRRTQTGALRKRFLDTIQRYQDVERNYQLKYRQQIERQIRIVKPEASQEEVDDIIDSDGPPQVFAQSLMNAGRQGQAKAVLSEVQSRHDDIKHIEKTIIELHQLFMDMSMMVEQQGETLNTVEANAEQTQTKIKEGNQFIAKAIQTAKSTRTKKWCCFFLCIGICVMIAILVWWFAFDHVGVGGSNNGQ
ncbi:t-SNARE [Rhizopus microsporus var. microsporus]|uniref:t-SNARE n=2 Tax=Rhizopus microsporus TaxID=58291 RepID=A0A2G4SYJ6_RHIZD|nr:t-SNARE [Rhizopus microsporus ATCC 52813]ORE02747.1 t-SNARE [Rhizopus microsporus var. microsporus]PHZ13456.1 t-SNARE [Rhizopus microsporus ATCC 52813]